MSGAPPPWMTATIGLCLPARSRAVVLGDLAEQYATRRAREGESAARRWYGRQVVTFVLRVPLHRWLLHPVRHTPAAVSTAVANFMRDFVVAARNLRGRPAYALPALAILTVAIAANTLVFSVLDATLLQPLPYPDPERLAMLWNKDRDNPERLMPITHAHYLQWRQRDDLFEHVAAWESDGPVVRSVDRTERVNGLGVSAATWRAIGARPAIGRVFTEDEDVAGADPVVVLSHRYWMSRFGGDVDLIGQRVEIGNVSTHVIGVMAPDFYFYDPYMFARSSGDRDNAESDLWRPLNQKPHWLEEGWRDYPALRVLVRLRDGVELSAVSAAVEAFGDRLEHPDDVLEYRTVLVSLRAQVTDANRPRLLLAAAAGALVLVIACANLFSLGLARSVDRRAELALRRALGASRWQTARLLLAEVVLLSAAAGGLALIVARILLGVAVATTPRDLPLINRIAIDGRVVLFTLAVGLTCAVLAGLWPALRGGAIGGTLGAGSRSVVGDRLGARLRFLLVATQVAVTLALVSAGVSMTRTLVGLASDDPGFTATGVLTFQSRGTGEDSERFHLELADRLVALPGVVAVGGSSTVPLGEWYTPGRVRRPANEESPDPTVLRVRRQSTIPGYFSTLEIDLLSGRPFDRADGRDSEPVVIVSQALYDALTEDGPGIDQLEIEDRAALGGFRPARIVAVTENVRYGSLREVAPMVFYVPQAQAGTELMHYALRLSRPATEVIPLIRDIARELDPSQPLQRFEPLDNLVTQAMHLELALTRVLGSLGFVALVLAVAGVYGAVAYSTRARLAEMGVRKTFGATSGRLLALMIRHSLAPVLVGLGLGGFGAVALQRSLAALVTGMPAIDPASAATAALSLFVASALAASLPAGRAATLDPVRILRSD